MNCTQTIVLVCHVHYVHQWRDFAGDFEGFVSSIINFSKVLPVTLGANKDFGSNSCFRLLVVIFF